VAQPIAELPITWNAPWITPCKNRLDGTQSNKLLVGIVYGF
jgi:hypothetical protein